MFEIVLWFLVFIISLAILLEASDYFTESAESIGLFFRLPVFIVGVTIVAIGTSLPELAASVFAVMKNSSEIVSGSVVGSNITNIFLIMGLLGFFGRKVRFSYEIINVDLPLLMGSALLMFFVMIDGRVSFFESILCLSGLLIFIFHTVDLSKRINRKKEKKLELDLKDEVNFRKSLKKFPFKSLIILLISSSFVFASAHYAIQSVIELSLLLKIGMEVIGASVVALGTSLPELVISFNSFKRGNPEIAIGNILGSNIFNSLGVIGVAGLFGSLAVPLSIISFGLPVMFVATLLYVFITQDKEITRWEGGFLIIFYIFYIGKLFNWF